MVAQKVDTFIDSHLMIENPSFYIPEFVKNGSKAISVHWETERHLHRTVSLIKELGASPGVVINPATPVDFLEEILPFVDYVLIMSVNPGFGGQKFINTSLRKIEKLKNLIEKMGVNVTIEVDGGIKLNNIEDVIKAGAEWIVVGSAIFSSSDPQVVYENTLKFKEKLEKFV
jgi:ribulose-phosphate 3-epimerase